MNELKPRNKTFHIYPNPSDGLISISIDDAPKLIKIEIQNVFGQCIYRKTYNESETNDKIDLTRYSRVFILLK
ncbi:MAG: T9SS type A sorting domain-containing protein [Bacteroidia bacterium]